jgi:hypothetical protein
LYIVYGQVSNWIQTSAPIGVWTSIASDSTGQYLAAVTGSISVNSIKGFIFTSSNG